MTRGSSGRSRNRRTGKQARATLNRPAAQRRAQAEASPATNAATASVAGGTTVDTSFTIPREQEYAFIRSDLRRLLAIAAMLLLVMVGLLLVID